MIANQEQLVEKTAKYLSVLAKVWLTYKLNTRVKGYVGDTSSSPHVSKVELDTQETVWTRNEGAVKESMVVCNNER